MKSAKELREVILQYDQIFKESGSNNVHDYNASKICVNTSLYCYEKLGEEGKEYLTRANEDIKRVKNFLDTLEVNKCQ